MNIVTTAMGDFDIIRYEKLQERVEDAELAGFTTFFFEGDMWDMDYAKQMLEFIRDNLKMKK